LTVDLTILNVGVVPTATTDLVLESLRRRLRALHSLYADTLATMDLGHVNHVERAGVLPIAFSLFHYTNMQDVGFAVLSGQRVLWDAAWQDRVRMAIDDHGKERTVDEMINQRIGDYEAFGDYQRAVFARTEAWLAELDGAELTRVLVPRPLPPEVANTFSARVAGEDGITVLDAVECWIYQHGLRHMGEIELARGLVGLGGMTT
jgi:DinB superfamily